MISIRRSLPLILAPIALYWAAARGFAEAAPHPLADPADSFGASLLPFGDAVAGGWSLAVAAGLAAAGLALLRQPGAPLGTRERALVVGAAAAALLTLDHALLMLLGYLPALVARLFTGYTEGLDDLLSPGLGLQLLLAAAAVSLLLELRRRTERDRVESADPAAELAAATRRTRRWTLVAMEAPLAYAATRVLMFVEAPGFRGFDEETRVAGLGLALASVVGAVLTWGLIRPWGERFPRWVPGLAGRRVPPDLAVIPALAVAALILAASRAIVVGAVAAGSDAWREIMLTPLVSLPHLLWPVWGVALALAALSYHRRRMLGDDDRRRHRAPTGLAVPGSVQR
ncbi:hypothetical protein Bcav_1819 [Beutenbergia cavernae DSM 12333]|uniref:Uncharacterized protein n=1 Tax=Beutenbergia cavernae (strain ATCC BAA-8 / DSM 12333 / CCUG 43141 / JCM 11478 / NBRC 16432 / NCIMB 13614 / HKI 0122) TaxID=471853 RepID=C5C4U7_BEUC1|nr:hypothetical protein [Beutenbergia cavernae]ACQ80075.1 hypothetical protein Bcav_1819 [Beutenbergia cavernae DSM 12333]